MTREPGASDELARALLADLVAQTGDPDLAWARPIQILKGEGGENLVAAVELRGGADFLRGPLILRRFPADRDPGGIRFEAGIQRALAHLGYPAPLPRLVREDHGPLGGAYMLMERLPGRALLQEVTQLDAVLESWGSAVRGLMRIGYEGLARVPGELAKWMLRLHAVDAGAVRGALASEGVEPDRYTAGARIDDLERRAESSELVGLLPALGWLRDRMRPPERPVVCHSDFHFQNILVDATGVRGVVDWSCQHICFEDREFDVGNTAAILGVPLPGLPGPVAATLRAAQRVVRRRFLRLYGREVDLDRAAVLWAEVYRCTREMVVAGEAMATGRSAAGARIRGDDMPWLIPEVRESMLRRIRDLAGVSARLPQ